MVIILTSGGHLEFLSLCKNISYDKNMQTFFFGMQTIYLISNLNIYVVFTAQYYWTADILAAILNFSKSSRVSSWHPVDYQSGPLKDSKSAKNNYVSPNSWFSPLPLDNWGSFPWQLGSTMPRLSPSLVHVPTIAWNVLHISLTKNTKIFTIILLDCHYNCGIPIFTCKGLMAFWAILCLCDRHMLVCGLNCLCAAECYGEEMLQRGDRTFSVDLVHH